MVHRQYLLGVELKQQRPQLVSTIAATTATTTTTILTQTHFEWNFSLTHFHTHTRTHTRATTDTHNWNDNNTVGGIGKSSHQRPWLRFLLILVRSSTNKQANKSKQVNNYVAIHIGSSKLENKAKSSHQYNRSYTLNCKRTTTIR